jgi:hypothetical protein
MIRTLAWKEVREHRAIWLAMVALTGVLGTGLGYIVAPTDPSLATAVAALTYLGMAATYGVVCGAMMLAGEHEGETLTFLDIFLGRRDLLWLIKFAIGVLLTVGEALAVALVLYLMEQRPPGWSIGVVGFIPGGQHVRFEAMRRVEPELWFLLLPVVTLEAYAWGLLGSVLQRRVLPAAALAALIATPIWLFALCAPSPYLLAIRGVAALVVLLISASVFASRVETPLGTSPAREQPLSEKDRFLRVWESFEGEAVAVRHDGPVIAPALPTVPSDEAAPVRAVSTAPVRTGMPEPRAPFEVLWWLTVRQAYALCLILAGAALLLGTLLPPFSQTLWPIATLLLGIACGTASFAPEQRDQSYQFLAAQHFPLARIWWFKTTFWLTAALLVALLLGATGVFCGFQTPVHHLLGLRAQPFRFGGTMCDLMGPALFLGGWLCYGFCAGQVFVWLCKKTILAVMLGVLGAGCFLGLWLPSLLCRGMTVWPVWLPPLGLLAANLVLVRAWAGGRIKERRPLTALMGCGAAALCWTALVLGYRVLEVPNLAAPLDAEAFRAMLQARPDNVAGQRLQVALTIIEDPAQPVELWLERVAEAAPLPTGIIEPPRSDGQAPNLRHVPQVPKMVEALLRLGDEAVRDQPEVACRHLGQVLALSRNLCNKAPVESYLAGLSAEMAALDALQRWLAPRPGHKALLEPALAELQRHAAMAPGVRDCVETEFFRASGLVALPPLWVRPPDRLRDRWLRGAIAMSLDTPWEAERKQRIWHLVWRGLFRAIETPPWQLPAAAAAADGSPATQRILEGWLAGDGVTQAQLAHLLDDSWLTVMALYTPVVRLREAATQASWRFGAARLTTALALYRVQEGKPAAELRDLVPRYLDKPPVDPYSGRDFGYRLSTRERIEGLGPQGTLAHAGQGVVWSTGPDRVDHGGRAHSDVAVDDAAVWQKGEFDLVRLVPTSP